MRVFILTMVTASHIAFTSARILEPTKTWLKGRQSFAFISAAVHGLREIQPLSNSRLTQNQNSLCLAKTARFYDRVLRPLNKQPSRLLVQNAKMQSCTLAELAVAVLTEDDPIRKIAKSNFASELWQSGHLSDAGAANPPDRPARPTWVEVVDWQKTAKRGKTLENMTTRLSLLHAITHIESYAIDLTWDLIARFPGMPKEFYDDWVQVAKEETLHFGMLSKRLEELGSSYGALPTHDGLWKAAALTSHDVRARLAIVHMVHEARGVDVTPSTINKFRSAKDHDSVAALERIYVDELTHVAKGLKWFKWICEKEDASKLPQEQFKALVLQYFGYLKGPFNVEGRAQAGMDQEWYEPLVKAVAAGDAAAFRDASP